LTVQYHFLEYFWPEFALNDTQWTSGERVNRNQLLVGPGIMFGRFHLFDRVKFNFGIAYRLSSRGRTGSCHNGSADSSV
jgi:hypothetical protein